MIDPTRATFYIGSLALDVWLVRRQPGAAFLRTGQVFGWLGIAMSAFQVLKEVAMPQLTAPWEVPTPEADAEAEALLQRIMGNA